MDANDFYSENVNQFINRKNTNPSDINEIINSNTEFVDSKVNLIGSRVIISGVNSRQAWVNFSCYRTSKNKYQSCRIKIEFIFDDQNKIYSYKELEIKDLKFTKYFPTSSMFLRQSNFYRMDLESLFFSFYYQ